MLFKDQLQIFILSLKLELVKTKVNFILQGESGLFRNMNPIAKKAVCFHKFFLSIIYWLLDFSVRIV
jgi:hypothetical protein